jgi:uncharacterized protein (DUF488 family)
VRHPLFTLGHSTRSLEELIALAQAHGIVRLVDVRRFPASRRHPHFGRASLESTLPAAGIEYLWREDLGGRRSRPKGAPPSAWRVPAFAAYADYMDTPPFRAAIVPVVEGAQERPTAVMCAEAFPYQCHRRLISDWVELHGTPVEHLMTATQRERHRLTPFARLDGDRVRYDVTSQLSLDGMV